MTPTSACEQRAGAEINPAEDFVRMNVGPENATLSKRAREEHKPFTLEQA